VHYFLLWNDYYYFEKLNFTRAINFIIPSCFNFEHLPAKSINWLKPYSPEAWAKPTTTATIAIIAVAVITNNFKNQHWLFITLAAIINSNFIIN